MPPELANLFVRLRYRIRRVLVLESVTGLVAAVGILFLAGMAIDYWFEPPQGVRFVVLLLLAVAAAAWLLRTLVIPLLWRLPDRQLALLVERRHKAFADSLVTAVDLATPSDETTATACDPGLLGATRDRALSVLQAEGEPELVSQRRVKRRSLIVAALLLAIGALAVWQGDALAVYARRLALSPEPWPRRVKLALDGFEQQADGVWRKRVARGDAVELVVRADLTGEHLDPGQVWLRTTDDEGRRTRESFARVGKPTTGPTAHQRFRHTLSDVRSDLSLRIRGGDARIEPIEIKLAPRPVVVAAELAVTPPGYLELPARRIAASALAPLPEGARVAIHFTANKPLAEAPASWSGEESAPPEVALVPGEREFSVVIPPLMTDRVLRVELIDTDGIGSAEPYPISLRVRPDAPPRVLLRLVGVGAAVTPDADVGIAIDIEDDHAIDSARVAIAIDDATSEDNDDESISLSEYVSGSKQQQVETSIDLLTRRFSDGADAGRLEPGQRIAITALATDRYDLADNVANEAAAPAGDRTTSSQRFVLEVITPSQLLARIEEREVNLRRTFEEVVGDMQRAHRKLTNWADGGQAPAVETEGDQPVEETLAEAGNQTEPNEARDARLELARRLDDVQKISQETAAMGESFHAIHEELVHNRIANSDLLDRVGERIARPLRKLHQGDLQRLTQALEAADQPAANRLAGGVVGQMEQILEQMKSLETYNEVLAMLRQVIDDQQRVRRATERSRREQVRRLLLE